LPRRRLRARRNHNGRSILYTGGAAAVSLRLNSVHSLADGWGTVIRNKGTGALTINVDAGVNMMVNGATVLAATRRSRSAASRRSTVGAATTLRLAGSRFREPSPGSSLSAFSMRWRLAASRSATSRPKALYRAHFLIQNDGAYYQRADGLLTPLGAWISPQVGMSLYECRATALDLNPPPGSYNTWLDLAQSWSWGWSLQPQLFHNRFDIYSGDGAAFLLRFALRHLLRAGRRRVRLLPARDPSQVGAGRDRR
jgi:hypothetical protein